MPKGSKKRKADKRRKELEEAKTKANDAAEPPPPAPNSQENSTGVATAAAASLVELADNIVEGVVQNKNVLARNVLGSKENEASKEVTLVIEIACNLPRLSNSETEASKENEGEKVLVDDDIIGQYSSKGKTEVDLSNEGNLLASFEVEKKSNEDMVAMGTDKQVQILDVSRGETNTEMDETYKESPDIVLQLNRIKEMVETGLSIADNMKELFLIIMDDLNAILDA